MNRTRFVLLLLITSAGLGTTGDPARATQLVPLDSEEELYSDVFSNPPVVVLLWNLDYESLQLRLFDPQGTPQGPPVDASSDDSEEPQMPWGGGLAWTGDSWLVAWVGAIFPYDQSSIFVRRFAKR
jgi:hypothetical protein